MRRAMKKFTVSLLEVRIADCWEVLSMMKIHFTNKGNDKIKLAIYCSIRLFLENSDLTLPISQFSWYTAYHIEYTIVDDTI